MKSPPLLDAYAKKVALAVLGLATGSFVLGMLFMAAAMLVGARFYGVR